MEKHTKGVTRGEGPERHLRLVAMEIKFYEDETKASTPFFIFINPHRKSRAEIRTGTC